MDIEQWPVIWLSLKEVLLLIEFFHESSTYWKAAQCTEARECRWPFKTCFASARAFLIWEQQQTVTVSYLCCCSSLLRIELRYKTLADKKKTFCQPVRERATVHRNNWGEHFIQPLNEGFQFMRRSGYKHRAGYRSVIWKRSFDFCEKLCVSLFNKECENISFKEKNSYYYLWRRCHLNILSPREWKFSFLLWWKFILFNYWLIISRRFCINVAELTSDVNVPE